MQQAADSLGRNYLSAGDPLFEITPDPTPQELLNVDHSLCSAETSFFMLPYTVVMTGSRASSPLVASAGRPNRYFGTIQDPVRLESTTSLAT